MAAWVRLPLPQARGEALHPVLSAGSRAVVAGSRAGIAGRTQGPCRRQVESRRGESRGAFPGAVGIRHSRSSSGSGSSTRSSSGSTSNSGRLYSTLSSLSRASPSMTTGSTGSRGSTGSTGLGVVCMAKGGKEKKGAKKGSLIPKRGPVEEGAAPAPVVPYTQGEIIMHSLEVIDSYFRAVGKPIFSEPVEIAGAAKALWEADFVVMSHGTEEDPIFNYGNQKALDLFETTWEEFTRMPSRQSASDTTQPNRNELLASAKEGAKDLKGILRVTTKGREFEVDDGVLWTLVASDGENFGQAAVFRQWHFPGEETEAKEGEAGPTTDGTPPSGEAAAGAPPEVGGAPAAAPQEGAEAPSGAP